MIPLFFAGSLWLSAAIAAAGLGLTWALYRRSSSSASSSLAPRGRRALAALSAASWLALAWFAAQPFWRLDPEIYHRPVVVLAVDESPSYQALGARAAAQGPIEAARAHYDSLGFDVRLIGFAERVGSTASAAHAGSSGSSSSFGTATHVSAVVRTLDSLALPNLQAVLLWSDGCFAADADGAGEDWPAPVYPVLMPEAGEPQGEKVTVDLRKPDEGGEVVVKWRGASGKDGARVEIRSPVTPRAPGASGASSALWSGNLEAVRQKSLDAAGESGEVRTQVFPLTPDVARRIASLLRENGRRETWHAILSGGKSSPTSNDTLSIQFLGVGRYHEFILRPVNTLEERGLIDALTSDSSEVSSVFASDLSTSSGSSGASGPRAGDVLWLRAGRPAPVSRASSGSLPRLFYTLTEDAAGYPAFDGEARIAWVEEGARYLPAEVLRLADLGAEGKAGMRLRAPAAGLEPLVWAEQGGRSGAKGLLVWREKSGGAIGFIVPPVWHTGFQPDAAGAPGRAARSIQARWVRGLAAWAREPSTRAQGSGMQSGTRGGERSEKKNAAREDAAKPMAEEMRILGTDRETLARTAAASLGSLIIVKNVTHNNSYSMLFPPLRGGQTRETRDHSIPLASPFLAVIFVAILFCGLWALRKRLRID